MKNKLKYLLKNLWFVLYVIALLATCIINLYLKFENVDMTSTRLFVTYWPIYIVEVVVIIGLNIIMFWKKND